MEAFSDRSVDLNDETLQGFKGVVEGVETEGFEITGEDHQPDVDALVEDGYELHIV